MTLLLILAALAVPPRSPVQSRQGGPPPRAPMIIVLRGEACRCGDSCPAGGDCKACTCPTPKAAVCQTCKGEGWVDLPFGGAMRCPDCSVPPPVRHAVVAPPVYHAALAVYAPPIVSYQPPVYQAAPTSVQFQGGSCAGGNCAAPSRVFRRR